MKFSIVITCYNNSRFLPLCLDSALRNIANKDGEIVCVDDCSTDETLSVLEEYAKILP
jgi:glycosyltransferase involved in cell wall biosynthesis